MLANDHDAGAGAVKAYNEAIMLAGEVNDFATREILEHILRTRTGTSTRSRSSQDQISHMTLPIFLTTQV